MGFAKVGSFRILASPRGTVQSRAALRLLSCQHRLGPFALWYRTDEKSCAIDFMPVSCHVHVDVVLLSIWRCCNLWLLASAILAIYRLLSFHVMWFIVLLDVWKESGRYRDNWAAIKTLAFSSFCFYRAWKYPRIQTIIYIYTDTVSALYQPLL